MINQRQLNQFAKQVTDNVGLSRFQLRLVRLHGETQLHVALISVPVPQRGQGRGSEAVRAVCALADAHGLPVHLVIGKQGDKSPFERLLRFYTRFGFTRHGEQAMIRPVQVAA